MSMNQNGATGPAQLVTTVVVRLAEAWFRQLEAQYALTSVTSDTTRFNNVLIRLDEASVGLVFEVFD